MNAKEQKLRISEIALNDKKNIIQRLEAGEKNTDLATEYGVSSSIISLIRKEKYSFFLRPAKAEMSEPGKRKKRQGKESKIADEKIYHWYLQKLSMNEQISSNQLKEKAIYFYKKFEGGSNFRASAAWFSKFKHHYQISGLTNHTGRLSSDETSIRHLSHALLSYIRENRYILDNVYNGDEVGLLWRSVPQRLLTSGSKHEELGWSIKQDRVTVMVCANVTGTHKIPLMVIGQEGSEYDKDQLPSSIVYREQENAWMNEASFLEWYKTVFLPCIKHRRKTQDDKFLLVMDSAPPHSSAQILNSIDSSCKVFFLPVLVSALIQPINRGAQLVKRSYRKLLLQEIIFTDEDKNPDVMMKYMHHLSISKGCEIMSRAWDSMTESKLKHCWKNVLPTISVSSQDDDEMNDANDIHYYLKQIIETITIEETYAWLQEDSRDPGWRILSDNELLTDILSAKMRNNSDMGIVIKETMKKGNRLGFVKDEIIVEDIKPVIKSELPCNEHEYSSPVQIITSEFEELEEIMTTDPLERNYEEQQIDPLQNDAQENLSSSIKVQEVSKSKLKRKQGDSCRQLLKHAKLDIPQQNENKEIENITSTEALECIEKFYKWFEKRKEATPIDLVHLTNMIKITNNIILHKYNV